MPLQQEFHENADAWFALETSGFPAVPRDGLRDVIAVRALLPLAVMDSPVIAGGGAAHESAAMGGTDHALKRIHLKSGAAPESLALVLAHELAHVSQIVNGGFDIDLGASVFDSVSAATYDKITALGRLCCENHDWQLPVYSAIPAAPPSRQPGNVPKP